MSEVAEKENDDEIENLIRKIHKEVREDVASEVTGGSRDSDITVVIHKRMLKEYIERNTV
jgi:hypothetical protein